MGVEEHRKKLMADGPTWGDRRSGAHVASSPCETVCNCEAEVLTPIDLMNHVVDPPSPLDSRISTYGWTLENILQKSKRFLEVPRVTSKDAIKAIHKFDRDGVPLIIEGLHKESNWPKEDFHPDWLKTHGPREISVRNVYDWTDKSMLLDQFIERSRLAPAFASPEEQERLYGKDTECPEQWANWLRDSKIVPSPLIPDNVEDLLSSHHVQTLMCYIGVGDTFTPCHKDLCASSGQNLMCYTEMNGSSFWFMTKGADAPEASKYFHKLKQELDHETHVITIEQLADAPFHVYIAEQKLGDLVLVPPRSCHQVVNYGGITIKTSWSRMTLKGLETAYYHELPIYRRVCRPETYRVKSTIYQALIKRRDILVSSMRKHKQSQAVLAPKTGDKGLISTTEDLLKLFDSVLLEESPPQRRLYCLQPKTSLPASPGSPVASATVIVHLTCDFCGADIFESFFECLSCVKGSSNSKVKHGDGFVICAGCCIEGRSCKCGNMDPIQCRPFQELLAVRNKVAELLSVYKSNPIPLLENTAPAFATGTFRVACLFQEMRKKLKGEERACSPNVTGSRHMVPCSWIINCKKCRRSRCFTHILMSQKLHAADALLIHASDSSHEEHHRYHVSSLKRYNEGRDSFFQTQRMGSKPDLVQQRVHLAEQYHTCKPINSAFSRAGWYDVYVQLIPIENNNTNGSQDSLISGPVLPPSSRSTEPDILFHLPLDISAPKNESSGATVSSPLKRKRTIMDFVVVPDRTYKVRLPDKLALTLAVPEPSGFQEIVPNVPVTSQLFSSELSTSSAVADNTVFKRDQEAMQTLSRNRASSHNPVSTSQTTLIPSPPETKSKNFTSFPSQKSETRKYTSKKRRPLPSSPTPPMSCSTPISPVSRSATSTSTQSFQPINRLPTSFTGEGESSRFDGPSSTPILSDQSTDLTNITDGSQQKSVPVRKLPRFKKNTRATKRELPEGPSYQSSSSSSAYPRSTPSDADLAQVNNGAVSEDYSVESVNTDPPTTEQTPSINNTLPQISPTTPVDSTALNKAITNLTDVARAINQLQHIPPSNYDPFLAFATALSQFTPPHSQCTTTPTQGWFQGNPSPMLLCPPSPAREQWTASRYQQLPPQYQNVRYHAAPPFEGNSSSRSPAHHGSFHQDNLYSQDGPMRYGLACFRSRNQDFYREDRNRRVDNRSHPYPRPRYNGTQVQEKLPRSMMRSENVSHRRPHPVDNRPWSHPTNSIGGRDMPEDDCPAQSPRAESIGTKSSTSTLRSQGNNDTENLMSRARPYEEHSLHRRPSPVIEHPQSLLEPPTDRSWERSSVSQVQQSEEAGTVQELLSHPLAEPLYGHVDHGPSVERHSSPTHSVNWEDDYEQEDVIVNEVPRIEPSKSIQLNEFSSPFVSLYDNPWAS